MNLSLDHTLRQIVYDGFFIHQIKSTLKKHDVTLAQHDYDRLQLQLVRIVSSQRRKIHEKTSEIIGAIESFTSSVKYIVDLKRDGEISPAD